MTKRSVNPLATAALAAALLGAPASALDISVVPYFGNQGLPWAGETALDYDAYPADLWNYGAVVTADEELGEGLSLSVGYETDPVLRHVVHGLLEYDTGLASLSAGPLLGVFNTAGSPLKAGISIGFSLNAPGIAFFSVSADSSMGVGLASPGDYSQERGEVSAGFYVRNAICTATMLSRKYTRIIASGEAVADSSMRYDFSVDVYKKNTPYRVIAAIGYQDWARTYADDTTDKLGSVLLGMEVHADVMPSLAVVAGLESGVYTFGLENLSGHSPDLSSFLFTARLGFVLRMDSESEDAEADE